jgi:hypothetical protein
VAPITALIGSYLKILIDKTRDKEYKILPYVMNVALSATFVSMVLLVSLGLKDRAVGGVFQGYSLAEQIVYPLMSLMLIIFFQLSF